MAESWEARLRPVVERAATEAGLDPAFVSRLVGAESSWNPAAIGEPTATGERARGLMQFMPATAKQYGLSNPHDPLQAIKAGVAYLKDLSEKFPGRPDLIAAAYHAGPGAVEKAGGIPPHSPKTEAYVAKVAGNVANEDTGTLAQRIRAKFPGDYDDLSDGDLETKWLAKYPEDADIPRTKGKAAGQTEKPPGVEPQPGPTSDAAYEAAKASGKPVPQGPTRGAPESFPRLKGFYRAMDEGLPAQALAGYGAGVVEGIPEALKGIYHVLTTNPMTTVQQFADTIRGAPAAISKSLEIEAQQPGSAEGFMSGLGRQASGFVVPEAGFSALRTVGRVARPFIRGVRAANPDVAAAVEAGQAAGIPVDAATATGNRAVAAIQHAADRTFGGSIPAKAAEETAAAALERRGGQLVGQAHPEATTPEVAGRAARADTLELERTLNQQANEHYGRLRQMEAEAEPTRVETAPPMTKQVSGAAERTLGEVPSAELRTELKRMTEELRAMPYQQGGLETYIDETGTQAQRFNKSRGNAPVYHDIRAAGSSMSGSEMADSIQAALDSGYYNQAAKAAAKVAKQRIEGLGNVQGATLPPSAGAVAQEVRFPTDLSKVKAGVQDAYNQLLESNRVIPLEGESRNLLRALHTLMSGPDVVSLSVADKALGDLKALARGAPIPELRTAGQARAAGAVKVMEAQVQRALEQAGPEAQEALSQGRAATRAKYQVRDVIETLPAEDVKLFRRATAPGDADIGFLRSVRETAPGSVERLGRAWLEDAMPKGSGETVLDHATRRVNQWRALGPETKKILFGSELTPELDKYFLLSKKMAETSNPSGTAHVLRAIRTGEAAGTALATFNPLMLLGILTGEVGAAGVSYLMHNPTFVKMLNRGTQLSLGKASAGIQGSAVARTLDFGRRLAKAGAGPAAIVGRGAGALEGLPAAAEDRSSEEAGVAR